MSHLNPEVSIIIVSYNTRDMTISCIRSIIKETSKHKYEILVIDNNSQDGSAEAIEKEFPQVNLIKRLDNLGFAVANNLAATHAMGSRLLLLNPDTLVYDESIDAIVSFADRTPDARLWGGRTFFPDGTVSASCLNDITIWSCLCRAIGLTWIRPTSKLFNPEAIHLWDPLDKERSVDVVVGCFLLIDRFLWEQLGGFNRAFFMYGEEVDLCLRARKLGARPRFTPSAKIIHYEGASEPSNEEKLIKVFKGRITVMRVHWHPLMAYFGQWTIVATAGLRAVASSITRPSQSRAEGQDKRSSVWSSVFRRRKEWVCGWNTNAGDH